jgi:hypothetical protein
VQKHPSLLTHAETLQGFPHEARPLPIGLGCGLYEMFARKHEVQADQFMKNLYTGEELERTQPEYLLRGAFIRDAQSRSKLPQDLKARMVVKGWNWLRRGNKEASRQVIALQAADEPKVRIY